MKTPDQDASVARLCLGRIPLDFRAGTDIAFAPFSFVGMENVCPDWDRMQFCDDYPDAESLWSDWTRVRNLANWHVSRLADELNLRHGTSYGLAYWRELLLLWLLLLIQAARVRDLAMARLVRVHGDQTLRIDVPARDTWTFTDDLDFMNRGIRNREFDAWLCGRLLRRRLPDNWHLVAMPHDDPPARPAAPTPVYPRYLSRLDSIPGMGRVFSILGSLLLQLQPPGPRRPLFSDDRIATDPRESFDTNFLDELEALIAATMPRVLTDDFAAFDNGAQKYDFHMGKSIITTATKYRAENRFVLAHAKQAGERIFRAQHGSGYGMARAMIAQEIEYFDSGFISWGWRRDDVIPDDAIALPSPMLSRLAKWKPRNRNIILIATNVELAPHPFKGGPQPSQWLVYRHWKVDFIQALPASVRADLLYRPRSGAQNDLEDLPYLEKKLGKLRILGGDLHDAISQCRLAVIDHPGTAMHVLMSCGVPTVMYWQRDAWTQHPAAEIIFDRLRTARILLDNPVDAANHVAAHADDIDAWWNSDDVRSARALWNDHFAYTDRAWRRRWFAWIAGNPSR